MEATIAELTAVGELDDDRFARRFAEDKRELRGWGTERIREALEARGLQGEVVEAAVAAEDAGDEIERAIGLLATRGMPLGDDAARGRAFGFLTRRGYDHETAYAAIRRASSSD